MKTEIQGECLTVRDVLKGQAGTGHLRTSIMGACLAIAFFSFLGGFVVDRIGQAETATANETHIAQIGERLKTIEKNMATRREIDLLRDQVTELQRTLNNLLLPAGRRQGADN